MVGESDREYLRRAIELARRAEREGNLPVGAVVTLDGEVVGEGASRLLEPVYHPGRHAEIVALEDVDDTLWPRAGEMTCFVTLEPCPMCAGALLLHGVGRVVFGARDEEGGAGGMLDHLPPYFGEDDIFDWEGPKMPSECRPLFERAREVFDELPVGRSRGTESSRANSARNEGKIRERLDEWLADADTLSVQRAREATSRLADAVRDDELAEIVPYAVAIFRRGGYLKDFRTLERYARRAGRPEAVDSVEPTLRVELPDIWVRRALERGDLEVAVERWFEAEGHARLRHVADELVAASGRGRTQLLISCRLARVDYRIGRGTRRHYRKACDILRKLRDELRRAGESEYWRHVVDDLRERYDNRPALLDELRQAGFL